jgi:hypothetical protein
MSHVSQLKFGKHLTAMAVAGAGLVVVACGSTTPAPTKSASTTTAPTATPTAVPLSVPVATPPGPTPWPFPGQPENCGGVTVAQDGTVSPPVSGWTSERRRDHLLRQDPVKVARAGAECHLRRGVDRRLRRPQRTASERRNDSARHDRGLPGLRGEQLELWDRHLAGSDRPADDRRGVQLRRLNVSSVT